VLDILFKLVIGTALGLLLSQVATWATSVYLHRALSHKAVDLHPSVRFGFRTMIWMLTGVKPREWVAVHRKHHAYTDVEGDPHSPVLLGWVRVELTNAALYRKVARDPDQVARYAKDLPQDRWDRALFDHGWPGLAIGITLMVLVVGPLVGLTAAVVHATSYLLMNAAVNSIGHTFGRRPYGNSATNLQWLAWLTGGEGLHNNHHEAPTSARFAHRPGEIDPSWWSIRALSGFRLATIRHRGPKGRTRDLVGAGTAS
jgi:stearoyl-CoA desaturase (delta-9 desaturase)